MKKFLLFLGAAATSVASYAQYSNFNSDSSFWDNWTLGADAGIQTNLHDWSNSHGAVFGIHLGKDFTPYFGMNLEALAGGDVTTNWFPESENLKHGKGIDYLTGFLTGRWNVLNSLGHFRGHRRIFELETNVGAGYGRFFALHSDVHSKNAFQVKTGLDFNFYVNEDRSVSINLRPALIWNISETGQFNSKYAVAQVTLGLSYAFPTSNGTHYFVKSDVSALQDELAALAALNADLQAQLANQPEPIVKEVVVEKIVEKVVEPKDIRTYVDNTFLVNFALNSSSLTPEAKATLDKVPAGSNATVAGYASPEGSKEYNLKLSDRRAEAVKAYLEARGVKVTKTTGYGAVDAESNRIVVVTLN